MHTTFLPSTFDPSDFSQIQPLLDDLLDRPLQSRQQILRWLEDLVALDEAVDEYGSRVHIEHTCHTNDADRERAYMHFVEQIAPRLKPALFALQQRLLQSPALDTLTEPRHQMLIRQWRAEVELYREENVPLQTQVTRLASAYGKTMGAMLVTFDDQQYTMQQMARFLEEPDRDIRAKAWAVMQARRLQDRETIESIFEQQLQLREQMAANADMANFRDYAWKQRQRFDYTPQQCLQFGDAVAELCMPLVEQLDQQRKQQLGLEQLRPWDLSVDPLGRAPLRPFDPADVSGFVERTRQIFELLHPELGAQFARLEPGTHLDLDSRLGKQPGGYQSSLERSRQPFIFMNAAGLQDDVHTLLHEGGHAFHYMEACAEPLSFVRHAPLEFCEVASMSMELLGSAGFHLFYPGQPELAQRARHDLLEGIIRLLPWIATIDGFQHWLYTHPGHTRAQRTQAWLDIHTRFSSRVVDWTGLDQARESMWQRQGHLFRSPFYYIEYGIAQLGALQVWLNYNRSPESTLQQLRRAFALGGTRPLPDLFTAAGIRFDFSSNTIAPLMEAVHQQLV